jgi:beta-phosphoglucomutase
VRALLFDFNGTLSDDEAIQCQIWRELFAEQGRPLPEREYYAHLAGLSDPEIVERWLGPEHPASAEMLGTRVRRFRQRAGDGSTVPGHVREAVRAAVGRARLGVVSGAARSEIEDVLAAAELDVFDAVVSFEDVARGKPDPEGYLRALELLDASAEEAAAIEDAAPGVAAAKAAGLYTVAVLGTAPVEQLVLADEAVERLDEALVDRLLEL